MKKSTKFTKYGKLVYKMMWSLINCHLFWNIYVCTKCFALLLHYFDVCVLHYSVPAAFFDLCSLLLVCLGTGGHYLLLAHSPGLKRSAKSQLAGRMLMHLAPSILETCPWLPIRDSSSLGQDWIFSWICQQVEIHLVSLPGISPFIIDFCNDLARFNIQY